MQNLVSWPGVNPRAPFPLHWECGVLATGPPGKSPSASHLLPFHFCITLFAHCENPTSWTTLQIVLTHFLSEKAMAPHSSTLAWQTPWMEEPGRLQSMGSLRVKTRLSDFTFTFHFHALEKEMATHTSVLAWRIQGTGEPGGLLSMGSHRVGHDWSDLAAAAAAFSLSCSAHKTVLEQYHNRTEQYPRTIEQYPYSKQNC